MPTMDAAKRGSGQRIAVIPDDGRPAEDGRPWQWHCTLCDQVGWAPTFRSAQNSIDTHQTLQHREAP